MSARFGTILADPPWSFKCWNALGGHKSALAHYQTRPTEWLCTLPVADVCAPDTVLFLWACWPMLPDALRVIEAWGFDYKTLGFSWVKSYRNGAPQMRLGYWTRANTEPCLLATRGKPKRLDKGVSQVIVSGLGSHSEKPEETYDRIERLVDGPFLEMFARPRNGLFGPRPGWTQIGDAATGRDIADDLRLLAEAAL